MSNQIIVPTGYMGSGSSAITDILSEIEGFSAPNASFEYIFLHCPDGLFDLEDKLLHSNNALRSDEAIYRFKVAMKSLYDAHFFWPGSYKELVSNSFYDYALSFVSDIITTSFNDSYWYFQEFPQNCKMKLSLLIRAIIQKTRFFSQCLSKPPLLYKTINLSFPSPELFYVASKSFINRVIKDLGVEKNNLILDQLLLPHNLYRLNNYFDNNIKVIVVDRDPRDVFILNKYVWSKTGDVVPFPFEVNEFITYYQHIRESEIITYNPNILRLHFEDLIYHYTQSTNTLYSFLNTSSDCHVRKYAKFNPELSRNNTQTYMMDCAPQKEIQIIEENLKEYLYPFPTCINHSRSLQDLF